MILYRFWSKFFSFIGIGENEEFSVIATITTVLVFISFFIHGVCSANKEDKCRIKTIGEFTIALPYALGCVVGKERFNWKVN